jgi:hypothetical protein
MNALQFIIFPLSLAACVGAQSILGSHYPLGISLKENSSMSMSMGGVSAGVPDNNHIMITNPANLGFVRKAVFSALATANMLNIHNENSGHTNHFTFLPQQVSFGFLMGKAGSIGLSFSKRSNAKLKYRTTYTVNNKDIEVGYARYGGLSSWELGWGYSIASVFSLGIGYERAFLTLRDVKTFQPIEHSLSQTVDSTSIKHGANGIKGGMMVSLKKWTVGISGEYFFTGDVAYTNIINHFGAIPQAYADSTPALQLPPAVNGGISYRLSPSWLFAADVSSRLWSINESYYPLPAQELTDQYSIGAGAQFIPAPNLLTPQYWETLHYRAGIRFTQLPASTGKEFAASLGCGFPVKQGGNLDLVIEYGRRTDSRYIDYTEEFLRVGFGFNGGRKWTKSTDGNY